MANIDHVVANRLTEKADAPRKRWRKIVLMVGIPLACLSAIASGHLAFFVFVATVVAFFSVRADAVIAAGAHGEDQALLVLKNLPGSFTLFNQIDIPNENSRTGVNEADLVVCGPSAVFVIEVKNNNGRIICDEKAPQWQVTKVGRGGTAYGKLMRNPISQTKNLVWLLGEHLKKTNSKPWVQGIVLFTNPSATIDFQGAPSMPVLRSVELIPYIQSFQREARGDVVHRATDQIARLRASRASDQPSA